jgi:hypothetical protein
MMQNVKTFRADLGLRAFLMGRAPAMSVQQRGDQIPEVGARDPLERWRDSQEGRTGSWRMTRVGVRTWGAGSTQYLYKDEISVSMLLEIRGYDDWLLS